MTRPAARPEFSRSALVPGLLGAIVLIAGFALIGTEWYLYVRYVVSILALILCVFAGQAKQWWWLAGLLPIAVIWNPVWPVTLDDLVLRGLELAASVVFVAAAIVIKVPVDQRR
jgi:hypothetical protein